MADPIIVMPVHNGAECIRKSISQALENADTDCRLVAIDNASTDESAQILREMASSSNGRVTLLSNPSNVGFPAACNQGIRIALEQGAEYVALLNQDAFACEGWLKLLISAARRQPDLGAVQALILLDAQVALRVYRWTTRALGSTPMRKPARRSRQHRSVSSL